MDKEEVKAIINEEVDKRFQQLGLIEKKQDRKHIYNPMYMHDSWYGNN